MDVLRIPNPAPNTPPSKAQGLVDRISAGFRDLQDSRKPGNNTKYSMHDAACSAFSVFFTQRPSFLSFQRTLERTTGRSNVHSLFGVHHVPTDVQIRNVLDSVSPAEIAPLIKAVGDKLKDEGRLERYWVLFGTIPLAMDGTDIYSSESRIHCPSCHVTHHSDGGVLYRHIAMTPALVAPGEPRVVALPPEFVVPQDGHAKQDREMAAGTRWIDRWGSHYAPWGLTLLGDALYSNQPYCQKALAAGFHVLLVCKPSSHPTTYEWVEDFARSGQLGTRVVEKTRGKKKIVRETFSYRFMENLPLRNSDDARPLNWLELTVTDESGKILYKNA